MSERMNPEVKAKWLAALRNGGYIQARNDLRVQDANGLDSFCCLGVLCDLYRQEVGGQWSYNGDEGFTVFHDASDGQAAGATLSDEIHRWAGAPISSIHVRSRGEREDILANWNDSGRTFSEIADLIEEEL